MLDKRILKDDGWHYYLNGKEVTEADYRAVYAQQEVTPGIFGTESTSGWPIHSEILAVHPTQIQEAEALAKARGVPTNFDPDGRPIFHTSRHFREYARKHGFRHKGYC